MTACISRRALAAGLLAASAAPAAASPPYFASSPALRGDDTARLARSHRALVPHAPAVHPGAGLAPAVPCHAG